MEIDELKKQWQSLRVRVDSLEADNRRLASELAAGRIQTTRSKLVRLYRLNGLCGFLLPLLAPLMVKIGFEDWLAIVYGVYGILLGCLNLWFSWSIGKADLIGTPVVEAVSKAIAIRKRQNVIRIVGIVFGAPVIASMFMQAADKSPDSMLAGMGAGLIVGLLIGIKKARQASKLGKSLQQEIELCKEQGTAN